MLVDDSSWQLEVVDYHGPFDQGFVMYFEFAYPMILSVNEYSMRLRERKQRKKH